MKNLPPNVTCWWKCLSPKTSWEFKNLMRFRSLFHFLMRFWEKPHVTWHEVFDFSWEFKKNLMRFYISHEISAWGFQYMLALDWWFIKELQFFYCYSFELNSLTLCLLHCLVRQSVISETNQISRPLPFNAERTTNRETRDGEEFWVLCDCYLNADMECSVGACAAQLKSIVKNLS